MYEGIGMKTRLLIVTVLAVWSSAVAQKVPKTWDEAALADWATPVAGLNLRPGHLREKDYYALPVENLRTYPVYYPGPEPAGYWDMLLKNGPKPLIEPARLRTQADWIKKVALVRSSGSMSIGIDLPQEGEL